LFTSKKIQAIYTNRVDGGKIMAILPIVQTGAEVLRQKCSLVENFDAELHNLLNDMRDTLKDAQGAGLAAPQVGVLKRVFLVVDDNNNIIEFINPKILKMKGTQVGEEGCLSVKGSNGKCKYGTVQRFLSVDVMAYNRYGQQFRIKAKGFMARAIQHEYDHLDGILYIDKATNVKEDI
jgi:peptide deformylase